MGVYRDTKFYKYVTQTIRGDTHIHLMLELSGLWKIFGHPDIDMDSSVKAWIEKGSVAKPIKKEITNLILWSFRLEFCRQFYKQHIRWPIVKMDKRASNKIKRNYQNNLWDETPTNPWRPEDFAYIYLQKNLDFDYHVDLTDLLSDKSIIPSLDQWVHEYDKQAHRTLHGRFPTGPPPTSKSAVVHYLSKESITVKEVIDQLQEQSIPQSWRVMVAVPKERELKQRKARFYGKCVSRCAYIKPLQKKT